MHVAYFTKRLWCILFYILLEVPCLLQLVLLCSLQRYLTGLLVLGLADWVHIVKMALTEIQEQTEGENLMMQFEPVMKELMLFQ